MSSRAELCRNRLELEPWRAQKSLRTAQRQSIDVPRQRLCPYIRSVSLGGLTGPASEVRTGSGGGPR